MPCPAPIIYFLRTQADEYDSSIKNLVLQTIPFFSFLNFEAANPERRAKQFLRLRVQWISCLLNLSVSVYSPPNDAVSEEA